MGTGPAEDRETVQALVQIDQKIKRLISALTESSKLTMPYINQAIEKLEKQPGELLECHSKLHKIARANPELLRFGLLTFEQKKLVADQLIKEIRLSGKTTKVIWRR